MTERKMLFQVDVSQLSWTRDPTIICRIACGKLLSAHLSGFCRNPSMQIFTITHTQKELLKMTYALLYANHSTPFKCKSLAFYDCAAAQLHFWSTRIAKVTVWPKKPLSAIGSTDNKSATTEDPWGALKSTTSTRYVMRSLWILNNELKFPSHRNHSSTIYTSPESTLSTPLHWTALHCNSVTALHAQGRTDTFRNNSSHLINCSSE